MTTSNKQQTTDNTTGNKYTGTRDDDSSKNQKDLPQVVQQGTNIHERLLNKPYVNDVTLRGQKSPLKCC